MKPCTICRVDARYRHRSRLCGEGLKLWLAYEDAVQELASYCANVRNGARYSELAEAKNTAHRAYRAHLEGT